ncbi:MAG: TRAP transporter large permease subunit [Betaproteobacteria bacterium]|nr:TRAP transporter large permease subunit [Betaproteobacteria bacterium]
MTRELMAPLMFGGLVVFMLIGYPVAFSLAAVGLFFGFWGIELGFFQVELLQALPERVFGIISNDLLLAIPFFTFMGAILERCGLAEDMLDSMGQLFGPVRGGLAYAVIIVGAILGAITGTVAASVIAMGLISLPIMMRYGYDMRLSTGVIAASGTITQLIPPSLVLVVLADQLGRSVGDMYAGAIGPSLVQILLFCLYILALSIIKPAAMPALPPEARTMKGWPLIRKCLWGMVPSVVLIFLVLGTILMGLATPTEGGAMGAVGAIVLAVLHHKEFSRRGKIAAWIALAALTVIAVPGFFVWQDAWMPAPLVNAATAFLGFAKSPLFALFYTALTILMLEAAFIPELRGLIREACGSTMRITAMVLFILVGSTVFGLVFRGVDGDLWIEHLLTSLPGGVTGFLIFVNIFVFFLAFFLDYFEIAFIIIPLLAPVATKLGIDLIWFGVLLGANMQTSFMHPPFGFALFYLRGVAPKEVKSSDIYWGAIPWVVLQLILVAILIFFPGLVTSFVNNGPTGTPSTIELQMDTPQNNTPDADGKTEQDREAADLEKAIREGK